MVHEGLGFDGGHSLDLVDFAQLESQAMMIWPLISRVGHIKINVENRLLLGYPC